MGLMTSMVVGAAGGAASYGARAFFEEQKALIEKERLAYAQELRSKEDASREEIRRSGRQADFEQDASNAPKKTEMEIDHAKAISDAERDAVVKRGSDREYLQAQRNMALAKRIVDPQITMMPLGDGTIMRVDARSGKALGVLNDPETGKPLQGKKDISESQLTLAKSFFTEGDHLIKNSNGDPAQIAEGQRKMQQGRDLLAGKSTTVEDGGKLDLSKFDRRKGKEAVPAGTNSSEAPSPGSPSGLMSAPPAFNEAGYRDAAATIAGAERGDAKAKTLLQKMLDEGGLSAGERARAKKAIGS